MKTFFDENLSPKLLDWLSDLFSDVQHARDLGLKGASDRQVWNAVRSGGVELLITTDRDFIDLVRQYGPPPKVLHLERADVKTRELEAAIRRNALRIVEMVESARYLLSLRMR
jgi:predicted nuclease of predicted toxin-antitoxin system